MWSSPRARSLPELCPHMVPPIINRVRGKNLAQRRRAASRERKSNARVAGKVLPGTVALKTSEDGSKVVKSVSKKKLKKKEQRARLLGKKQMPDAMET